MQHKPARILAAVLLVAGCSRAAADTPSVSPEAPATGSSEAALKSPTQTQIDEGARLFGAHCGSCHGAAGEGASAPMLVGEGALPRAAPEGRQHRTGEFETVASVYEFVRTTMPPADPGVLTDDEVWAILAFDLKANGIELDAPLVPETAASLPLQ